MGKTSIVDDFGIRRLYRLSKSYDRYGYLSLKTLSIWNPIFLKNDSFICNNEYIFSHEDKIRKILASYIINKNIDND